LKRELEYANIPHSGGKMKSN